jgi:broad specificity phosphatase PhoE
MAVLVRHGETLNNRNLRFQGTDDGPDAQLTQTGRDQAKAVRDVLEGTRFDAIWASPLGRTRETAEIITSGRNLPIQFDDRLKEIDFGELNGQSLKDYFAARGRNRENWWEDNWDVPYPGGESFSQLYQRVSAFGAMCRQREDSNILIVTHSTPLKMILSMMEDVSPHVRLPMYVPTCGAFKAEKVSGEIWSWKQIYPAEVKDGYIT